MIFGEGGRCSAAAPRRRWRSSPSSLPFPAADEGVKKKRNRRGGEGEVSAENEKGRRREVYVIRV